MADFHDGPRDKKPLPRRANVRSPWPAVGLFAALAFLGGVGATVYLAERSA